MEEIQDIEIQDEDTASYRDELNFAEFPLASLSTRLPDDQKTLVFTDTIFDQGKGKEVTRKLTISAADKYGLPTAMDDEVILGLIQLTNQSNFEERKIHFTRYELIKLLGWRDDSKSYLRVADSLKRWLGVTLYYDRAWWSKDEKCWVSENFHILDQVTIFDKERRERRLKTKKGEENAGRSSFIWNEVVFDSFQAGYLKKLDMRFYRKLDSPITKRIYRFLDKRFYRKETLTFDMKEFALEHIGLSRNYHNGEIKRRLIPAINELEKKGFLEPLSKEEVFKKKGRGKWTITCMKRRSARTEKIQEIASESPLVTELVNRGITRKTARVLVNNNPVKLITEKIELFDWLGQHDETKLSANPAGFLYKAIVDDYKAPKGFETKSERGERLQQEANEKAERALREKQKARETERKRYEEDQKIDGTKSLLDGFWNNLSEMEKKEFEEEALKYADKFIASEYRKGKEKGGTLFRFVRKSMLEAHIRRKLQLDEAA